MASYFVSISRSNDSLLMPVADWRVCCSSRCAFMSVKIGKTHLLVSFALEWPVLLFSFLQEDCRQYTRH